MSTFVAEIIKINMSQNSKLLKDVQAGDTIYYLPGNKVFNGNSSITKEKVSKVELEEVCGEIYINIFLEGFHKNKYPEISYSESDLDTETFVDMDGYYSTQEYGIQSLFNEVYESDMEIAHHKAYEYVSKINGEIKEIHKNFLDIPGAKRKELVSEELMVVPKSIIKNILTYCENQSIYDKLSDYDDFYYKLKRVLNSQNKSI